MSDVAYDSVRLLIVHGQVRSEWYLSHDTFAEMKAGRPLDFVVMCYGCPSHPYDQSAALMGAFLSAGLVLVYPHYIGTWGSGGTCTLENAVDTVGHMLDLFASRTAREIRHDVALSWNVRRISAFGGSFGASVVLVAAAKWPIDSVIAVSPVIDWRRHGRDGVPEEDLSKTYKVIATGFSHLWRIDEDTYSKLRMGQLDLSPIDYKEDLVRLPSLMIHACNDEQVSNHHTMNLSRWLQAKNAPHTGWFPSSGGHLILYHMGAPEYSQRILEWYRSVNGPIRRP